MPKYKTIVERLETHSISSSKTDNALERVYTIHPKDNTVPYIEFRAEEQDTEAMMHIKSESGDDVRLWLDKNMVEDLFNTLSQLRKIISN